MRKYISLALFIFSLALIIPNVRADITLDFVSPTDANDTYLLATSRNWTFVNASVTNTSEITGVSIEWDGVNVTLFNKSSLVGLWHLNNDTKDYSGNGNDGTQSGGVNCSTSVTGKFGTACWFDGNNDRIVISNSLGSHSSVTISLWFYLNSKDAAWHYLLDARPEGNWYLTKDTDNNIEFGNSTAYMLVEALSSSYSAGVWTHVMVIANSSGSEIFINGISQDTGSGSSWSTNNNLDIGSWAGSQAWNGTIDEVRIYNRSLTSDEINRTYRAELGKYLNANVFQFNITDNTAGTYKYYVWANQTNETAKTEDRYITFTSNPTVILNYVSPTDANATTITVNNTFVNVSVTNTTEIDAVQFEWNFSGKNTNVTVYDKSSLVGLWHLNNDTKDYSGWGNDGTINNDVNCSSNVGGKFRTACDFPGTDDRIEVSNTQSLNISGNQITLMAWVKPAVWTPNWQTVVNKRYGGDPWNNYILSFYASTLQPEFGISNCTSPGCQRLVDSPTAIPTNQWSHLAGVYNSSHIIIYVDAVEKNTLAVTGNIITSTELVRIGSAIDNDNEFNGIIDEVRIYNRSLTADEINITYRSELGKYLNSNVFFQNFTDMADGTYNYRAYGNMTDGTANSTGQMTLFVGFPTWSNNATNSTTAGTWVNHSVVLSDNIGLDYYIFEFDNGTGTPSNDTAVDISGTSYIANTTKLINSTIGSTIRWRYYFNDTSNNWNVTDLFSYTTNGSITVCQSLNQANTVYTLGANVSSDGTCFTITANNVTLDGNGYAINHSTGTTAGYGVLVTSSGALNNITIRNFLNITLGNISQAMSPAVYMNNTINATVFNVSIYTNSSGNNNDGIMLANSTNTTIENSTIIVIAPTTVDGIDIDANSKFNTILNNTIRIAAVGGIANPIRGIRVLGDNTTIRLNTISDSENGNFFSILTAQGGDFTIIDSNKISSTGGGSPSIIVGSSDNIIIRNNVTDSNGEGINLGGSNVYTVARNNVSFNNITLLGSSAFSGININRNVQNNTISDNIIKTSTSASSHGITFIVDQIVNTMENNTITRNNITVTSSSASAIRITNNIGYASNIVNNTIYNNIFNVSRPNTDLNTTVSFTGAYISNTTNNTWNTTLTSAVNIIGGNNIGGNYYGNSSLTGFSDTCTDSDDNGICDSSLQHDENNTDYFPLASPPPYGLDACGTLDTANMYYKLTNNVSSDGTCFTITADNVTLDGNGYTINYSTGTTAGYGILVNGSGTIINATIRNFAQIINGNIMNSGTVAIFLNMTINSTINNNTINIQGGGGSSYNRGIWFTFVNSTNITGNFINTTVSARFVQAINMDSNSRFNIIKNNTADAGKGASYSTYEIVTVLISGASNTVENNTLYMGSPSVGPGYTGAIIIDVASNNIIVSNSITGGYGIVIFASDNLARFNNITNNTITTNNMIGILISRNAQNNNITRNKITATDSTGATILMQQSFGSYPQNNQIYDNILNISRADTYVNFTSGSRNNTWNTTLTSAVNIIGGNNIGGNYYGNSSLTGFSDTCADSDDNGICDSSLQHDENNTDYLPLAAPPPYGLDACGTLGTANMYYKLTNNVSSDGTCFTITANNVTLDGNGYAINYSTGTTAGYGILVNNTGAINGTTIKNFLEISNGNSTALGSVGIYLNRSSNALIQNNTIIVRKGNTGTTPTSYGIQLYANTNYTTIEGNLINGTVVGSGNTRAVTLVYVFIGGISRFNTIRNNTLDMGTGTELIGSTVIYLDGSTNNQPSGNRVENNTIYTSGSYQTSTDGGIIIDQHANSTVVSNIITVRTTGIGIQVGMGGGILSNHTISNNTIYVNSGRGIYIARNTFDSTIAGNTINVSDSRGAAIHLFQSAGFSSPQNSTIYNNLINISRADTYINISGDSRNNSWNTTLTSGVNIIGGNNIGGNYYGNSSLTGFSDTCTDSDDNGICDSSLQHDENNTDYFPLASPPPYGLDACGTLDTANMYYKLTNNVSSDGTCFTITADNVTLDGNGMTLNYSTGTSVGYGINASNVNNATIKNFLNITLGNSSNLNSHGIYFVTVTNSTIDNNTIVITGSGAANAGGTGIVFSTNSNYNNITNNTITVTGRGHSAIYFRYETTSGNNNLVQNNVLRGSGWESTVFDIYGDNNKIYSNIITNAGTNYGTSFGMSRYADNNIIENNTITSTYTGLNIGFTTDYPSRNNVTGNNITITGSYPAISLAGGSRNSTITRNRINATAGTGAAVSLTIWDNKAGNSTIYDNVFNVSSRTWVTISSPSYNNSWNITLTSAVNIIGGNNIGGNYYGNSSRTGFSDTCTDADFNGICDSSLQHDENNTDYLPLTNDRPPGWSNNQSSYPSQYSPSLSIFNITWQDSFQFNTSLIEINYTGSPINYTMVNLGSNVYSYNVTLPAGSFYWKSYGNDTANNWNATDTWYFTINKNQTNPIDIYLINGTGTYKNQNITMDFGEVTTANATMVYQQSGTASLFEDGPTTSNPRTTTLSAGTHSYKGNTTGNANYSSNSTGATYYIIVNPATYTISIELNATNVRWNEGVNLSGYASKGTPFSGWIQVRQSSTLVCNITTTNGYYSCVFSSPSEVGNFTYTSYILNTNGDVLVQNSTVLTVAVSYGGVVEGKNVACYEEPRIIQNPDGSIKVATVRICAWK